MLNVFISGVLSVATIVILMLVGVVGEKKGWFNNGEEKLLGKLVVNFALPAKLISSFLTQFSRESMLGIGSMRLLLGVTSDPTEL